MFSPKSVAVFGASDKIGSVGKTITDNLINGAFPGPVWPVNPRHRQLAGHECFKDAGELPEAPDLAVIATPPKFVPGIVADLGDRGTRAVVVITAGLRGNDLTQQMLDAAQPHCLRVIGPNCFGIMVPGVGLNASFAHAMPLKGDLAFISQSGAVVSAVLDWANGQGIGFSHLVSMGNMADVDLGDMLDYLADDTGTRAVLMYLEQITDARKFMSAARAAARIKPVVVIKSGRHEEAAKAAHSHTGALAGSDAVYNAAFHRAGILRVVDLEDMFDAAEALSRMKPPPGDRLAIVTNGGGAGVLAVDRLVDFGGTLATLADETIGKLNRVLPATWSGGNPVDIIGDASPDRYETATEIVLSDPGVDGVLVMNCPTALASSVEAARATLGAIAKYKKAKGRPKSVLAAWLGDSASTEARTLLSTSGLPTYETPADAVRGFTYLTRHARDQRALMQVPESVPKALKTDRTSAAAIINRVLKQDRELLTEPEAKSILASYGIVTVETAIARTPTEVETEAGRLIDSGQSELAIKILSKQITHKSDVGGVVLGLPSAQAAYAAAEEMQSRIHKTMPQVHIEGFTVQPMVRRPGAHELIIGVNDDPTFGPVILFGAGGTAVEVIKDTAIALPPLDLKLAHDLMDETRVYKLLQGYRDRPPADLNEIALTLMRVSQLIADLPQITELDINPLLADENGVIALDARIAVKKCAVEPGTHNPRFAIRPYPAQWQKVEEMRDGGRILMRPIKPNDARYYDLFMEKMQLSDIRLRLFNSRRSLSPEFIARLTQIDYARAMAFVAIDEAKDEMLGVSRLACDPDHVRAEFAVITRSDMKGRGIGWALMQRLIQFAEAEDIHELWGQVLSENATMLDMCHELGFTVRADPDDRLLRLVSLRLE
ncbi:GNAT family N-acetyltransferase [Hoeflea sp. TYP-13]|uniref:bifunctional acetate--CoA ligase family protein/GNAT family N-acetyltransferase n=1 Tax=Hoeflea sp. TYP-13 TaxID=3230023 RepID=UPI0034C61458